MRKEALDYAGDSFPGEEPQFLEDHDLDHEVPTPDEESYRFFYGNGQLHVSDAHDHAELSGHAGVQPDHTGPMAVGHILVTNGKATFAVNSNIHAQGLARVLKDYAKQTGWRWGGMTTQNGEPVGVGSEFAPVKSYIYAVKGLANEVQIVKQGAYPNLKPNGVIYIDGKLADVRPLPPHLFESFKEFADDQGLQLCSGNDNVLKRIEDLEVNNNYTPEWNAEDDHFMFRDPPDERAPGGVYKCPDCSQIFPNWGIYIQHRKSEEPQGDPHQDDNFPELDMDATFPPHFHDQPTFHEAAGDQPKDMIMGPIPFIYDIQEDTITVGQPGTRTSDIPGKFTPGGLVEGTYEPGGKIALRSMTNMPYTVRHMLELWYYQHPHMEITGVHLEDNEGKKTRLAANEDRDVGGYLTAMLAKDPTAWKANHALLAEGGQVFIVGGAVRDALLGKPPKDIDLMVTGLPADKVDNALRNLPGRVDLTGKDFGVFRYKDGHGEVEIALPRRERSTGAGHQDFDVQADHTMSPEEDLYRRDFTINAIAVDTSSGQLIDPFNGVKDIQAGRLRTLNTKSLSDDPLRTVRALVASSKHGVQPDEETMQQMEANAAGIRNLPRERIQAELDKLFASPDPAKAVELARDTGLLEHIFPPVHRAMGHSQNNPHHELLLGDHLVNVLRRTAEKSDDPDLRLAGLLHDVGKVDSHWTECRDCGHYAHGHFKPCPECGSHDTSGHFYKKEEGVGEDHETIGAEQAAQWMRDMKYPAARTQRVQALIQHHMFAPFSSPKGARKFLNTVGDHADDLMKLRWADQGGKSEYPTDPTISLDHQQKLIDVARQEKAPTALSALAVNGKDLMDAGIPQGPQIGQVLQHLMEQVVVNPELNTKEALLGLARAYAPA